MFQWYQIKNIMINLVCQEEELRSPKKMIKKRFISLEEPRKQSQGFRFKVKISI